MRNLDHIAIIKDERPHDPAWVGLGCANLVLACGQKLPNITRFTNRHISSVNESDGIGCERVGKHRVLWGGSDGSMAMAISKYGGNAQNTVLVGAYGAKVKKASEGAAASGRSIFVIDPSDEATPGSIRVHFGEEWMEVWKWNGVDWETYTPVAEVKTAEQEEEQKQVQEKVDKKRASTRKRRSQKKRAQK